jgi:hypothetical protein
VLTPPTLTGRYLDGESARQISLIPGAQLTSCTATEMNLEHPDAGPPGQRRSR